MKMAIVSSYGIECGIARFSEILYRNLAKEHDVTVHELPNSRLKKSYGASDASGNQCIDELCAQLKGYDAVSIQCEYGLFADDLGLSIQRIKKLIAANANTTVTFHTLLLRGSVAQSVFPGPLHWLTRPRSTLLVMIRHLRAQQRLKHELGLLAFINHHKTKVIVHTESTQNLLQRKYKLADVSCHPLCYTTGAERLGFQHADCHLELITRLGLGVDTRLVGIFGFFGSYKGFDYAIRCLSRLPSEFKLLIFSGLHPSAIKTSDTSQIDALVALARKHKVLDRTFFMGSVDDNTLYRAIAGVDYGWLPYRETGQEASGICSEVAELSKRMILSRNLAFIDYIRFKFRDDYEFFEIGNVEELRLKTLHYDDLHPARAASALDHATLQASFYARVLSVRTEPQTATAAPGLTQNAASGSPLPTARLPTGFPVQR